MNGVFSPIAFRAAVAFCTLSLTLRAFAEGPCSDSPTPEPIAVFAEHEAETTDRAVYEFVGYVTLSPSTAFSDANTDQITTHKLTAAGAAGSTNEGHGVHSLSEISNSPIDWMGIPVVAVAVTDPGSSQQPANKSPRFVARPLSAIRLDHANKPMSRTGAPLKTPAVESTLSVLPVEEHFTPAPWHRAHPDRNTFPFRHNPLYFEDPNLERCGHSAGYLTEAVNIAHFAGRIPIMSYMMASNPPCQCVRALPDCPTCHSFGTKAYIPEPTVRAIAAQAAASTGIIFLIP